MHLALDTWSGRICLLLGLVLLVWGACREPMLPTRQVVVDLPAKASMEETSQPMIHEDGDPSDELVIVRLEEEKAER